MKKFRTLLIYLLVIKVCANNNLNFYNNVTSYSSNNHLNMIVEIPAGTNKKIEYSYAKKNFAVEMLNGKMRIIDFLPYPANYGFVPSTMKKVSEGGDGDPLDVILISESIDSKTIIEVKPIGILLLKDFGEDDSKIIAIPIEEDLRIISAKSFDELSDHYPKVKEIIKIWFLNYKGNNSVEFIGWGDEILANREIENWLISK